MGLEVHRAREHRRKLARVEVCGNRVEEDLRTVAL